MSNSVSRNFGLQPSSVAWSLRACFTQKSTEVKMLSWSCSGSLASNLPPWFGLRDRRPPALLPPIHIPSHVQSRDPSTYMWSVNFARVEKIMKPETFPFLKKGSTLGTIFVPFLYHRDPLHLPAFDLSTLPELRKKENLSLSPISAYPKLNFNRVGKK